METGDINALLLQVFLISMVSTVGVFLTTTVSRIFFLICIGSSIWTFLFIRSFTMDTINRLGTVEGVEVPMLIFGLPLLTGIVILAGSYAFVTAPKRREEEDGCTK